MTGPDRRVFLGAGALLSPAAGAPVARATQPGGKGAAMTTASIETDLLRYVGYGEKRAGGPGDTACGEWLAGELLGLGYEVERQTFSAPFFDAQRADIEMGGARIPLYPQPIVDRKSVV